MQRRLPSALAILLMYVVNADATTLLYKSLDDLTAESELIVVSTVAKTESLHGPDDSIYTFVTLEDMQAIKGRPAGSTLTLRVEGGQVGHDVLDVAGSPHFKTGERFVLFIRGNGTTTVPFVGWTQGVFRAVQDLTTNETIVTDYDGNKLLGVSDKHLVKETRFASGVFVVDEARARHSSSPPRSNAGTADDGSLPSSADDSGEATRPPTTLDAFLTDVKARTAAVEAAPEGARIVHDAGLPEIASHSNATAPMDPPQKAPAPSSRTDNTSPPLPQPLPPNPNDR